MSFSEKRAWLVCYDIACPRRLARVHHYLAGRALPIQYSVFAAVMSERELGRITPALAQRIDPGEDDIRIYPVPAMCDVTAMGERLLPLDVVLPDAQLIRFLLTGSKSPGRGGQGIEADW